MAIGDRLAHAWNAFTNPNKEVAPVFQYGGQSSSPPNRTRFRGYGDKTIISSIYNRIAIDAAAVELKHARLDENGQYIGSVDSYLNQCLTVEANIDQGARAFRQDIVMTMMDEGAIAIVPIDTTDDMTINNAFDIKTMRVAKIINWYPRHVMVDVYNDQTGQRQQIRVPKSNVAIVENPLASVMNEPNGTLQRLIRKLNMLDAVDEQATSGKLDLIIQLPYVIKTETKRDQATQRRKDLEDQLKNSQHGIVYTDGTEKITQLNRPVDNNMLAQIVDLTAQLYAQLGLTKEVFDGTASEQVMLNYYARTIQPILTAIAEEMKRSFLTKTARAQGQSIEFFRDPFSLVPVSSLAEIADKFTRNEILSANEIRGAIGFKPHDDPKANELRNSNVPQPADPAAPADIETPSPPEDQTQ